MEQMEIEKREFEEACVNDAGSSNRYHTIKKCSALHVLNSD